MKIRKDYVSNSSSSSFIINGTQAESAMERFFKDFDELVSDQYEPMGESFRISIVLNSQVSSWDSTDYNDFSSGIKDGSLKFEDVALVRFECDDWDKEALTYLHFMSKYFKRLGYELDDSDSERDYERLGTDTVMGKLLSIFEKLDEEEKTKKEIKKK